MNGWRGFALSLLVCGIAACGGGGGGSPAPALHRLQPPDPPASPCAGQRRAHRG